MHASALTYISLVLTAAWIVHLLRAALYGSKIGSLQQASEGLRLADPAPRLSIVIAARDEAHTLRKSLPKLLALNYPSVEFILIDDRSTDSTGALFDDLASQDERVHVIHCTSLPAGWLGKVHALSLGERRAEGEWLLFTDADIHFEPQALEHAIAYAEAHALDILSVIPESHATRSVIATAFESAFGTLFVQKAWPPNLPDATKPDAIGVGAFNLVRRASFDKTPGFEWLRMEILDDIGVGILLKQHGFRQDLLFGTGLVSFEWYVDTREMIKGLEKNLFAGFGRYSYLRMTLVLLGFLVLSAGPIVSALLSGSVLAISVAILGQFALPALIAATSVKRFAIKPTVMAALPIGMLLLVYAGARSTYSAWKVKGIRWRDTFYPLAELRKLSRVKL